MTIDYRIELGHDDIKLILYCELKMAKTFDRLFQSNPETVYEACRKVIADSGYSIISSNKDDFTISFNTGRSMSSWHGQDLTVTLFAEADQTKAVVGGSIAKGGSALTGGGSQVFAWGEKDKLSKKFLGSVESILPHIPVITPAVRQTTVSSTSVAGEIKSLLDLKEAGALTDEEFEAAKSKLLGS